MRRIIKPAKTLAFALALFIGLSIATPAKADAAVSASGEFCIGNDNIKICIKGSTK